MRGIKLFIIEYWLYIVLAVVFFLIRVCPISINAFYDDVFNNIALGGFASVLVAFLIKINDDKSYAKRSNNLSKRLIFPLMQDVAKYMDVIIECMFDNNIIINKTDIKSFEKWNSTLYFTNNKLSKDSISKIQERINILHKDARDLLKNEDWYLLQDILDVNTVEKIKKLTFKSESKAPLLCSNDAEKELFQYNLCFINKLKDMPYFYLLTELKCGHEISIDSQLNKDFMKKEI